MTTFHIPSKLLWTALEADVRALLSPPRTDINETVTEMAALPIILLSIAISMRRAADALKGVSR
jgi:hypothetical protein